MSGLPTPLRPGCKTTISALGWLSGRRLLQQRRHQLEWMRFEYLLGEPCRVFRHHSAQDARPRLARLAGSPGVGFYNSVDTNWSGCGLSTFSASHVGSSDTTPPRMQDHD